MDPDACVERIISELSCCEFQEALEALSDLRGWLSNGGFKPVLEPGLQKIVIENMVRA